MERMLAIAIAAAFMLIGGGATAQDGVAEDVTEYFMDVDSVEGTTLFPSEGLVTVRHHGKSKSLIKVRRHFVVEMIKTVENI
jgi:hypothetical protein